MWESIVKKEKNKFFSVIFGIILSFLLIAILIFSGIKIINWYLNNKGVLTPSNYKKQNGSRYQCRQAKHGVEHTKWTIDTISTILKNEAYKDL